jgi:hypothetical protein
MYGVNPFVRLGFEGREYWGVGNAVNALSSTEGNTSAVGAYGMTVAAGVGW